MFDISKARRDFPILSSRVNGKPLVYFDNAATTQKPRRVIDRLQRFYKLHNSNVHRGSHSLSNEATGQFEAARQTVADFLNAPSKDEIIWTKGATEAANLLAYSLSDCVLASGDTILVSVMEHHANIVPWQLAAARHGASVIPIPLKNDHSLDLATLERLIEQYQPKIVAITHVSNALGVINPIQQIADWVHQAEGLLVVDGSQAVAHLDVDLKALNADAYFFSGHKCYGPTGIGVLWARLALLEKMPPWQSGGEMIRHVSFEKTTFNRPPFKFEAGTPPIADAIGLAEALNYLSEQDRTAIQLHEQTLRKRLVTQLSNLLNITIFAENPDNVGIVSLVIKGWHHQDLALLLDEHGIAVRTGHHCAMPLMAFLNIDGTLRISLGLYSTEAEVDHLCAVLHEITSDNDQHPDSLLPSEAHHTDSHLTFNTVVDALPSQIEKEITLSALLQLGHQCQPWPTHLREQANKVDGCESNVWTKLYQHEDRSVSPLVDSDARIMRGLGGYISHCFSRSSADDLCKLNATEWLQANGFARFLSPSRTNGVLAILSDLQEQARKL